MNFGYQQLLGQVKENPQRLQHKVQMLEVLKRKVVFFVFRGSYFVMPMNFQPQQELLHLVKSFVNQLALK